jgi:capsule polysaccharide export protein KpsE/RkpR
MLPAVQLNLDFASIAGIKVVRVQIFSPPEAQWIAIGSLVKVIKRIAAKAWPDSVSPSREAQGCHELRPIPFYKKING